MGAPEGRTYLRTMIRLCAVMAFLSGPAALAEARPRVDVSLGVGLPELLHAQLGYFVTPKVTLEARYANAVFNPVVGLGATYRMGRSLDGQPPRHALLLSGHLMANPTRMTLVSSGDTIGAYARPAVGYGFSARGGFTFRAEAAALVTVESEGIGLGPDVSLGVGWAF